MVNYIIFKDNYVAIIADMFKSEGAASEARSNNWELGNRVSICLETEKNHENLCRNGRSQDLPAAH
jgi:hypothetical protein